MVLGSDVVVLAVKPNVIPAVLKEIEQYLTADSLVVSIAAGVNLAALEAVRERTVFIASYRCCLVCRRVMTIKHRWKK